MYSLLLESPANNNGFAKSANDVVNTKSHALNNPGIASGNVIDENVLKRPADKFNDASSYVESIACKTPLKVKNAIGNIPIVCTKTSPGNP